MSRLPHRYPFIMAVFLCGYGRHNPLDMLELADRIHPECLIADIRYFPQYGRQGWKPAELCFEFGERYEHWPEFGNKAKMKGGIEIANLAGGIAKLRPVLADVPAILFFCACGSPEGCHRTTLKEELEEVGIVAKEKAWPVEEKPPGWYWNKAIWVWQRDPLAEMEYWAQQHPEKMNSDRQYKLDVQRWRYQMAEELVMRENLTEIDNERPWIDWETVMHVVRRIEKAQKASKEKRGEKQRGRRGVQEDDAGGGGGVDVGSTGRPDPIPGTYDDEWLNDG